MTPIQPHQTIVLHPDGQRAVSPIPTPWDIINRATPGRILAIVGGKVVLECKSPQQALQARPVPKRPQAQRVGFATRVLSLLTLGKFRKTKVDNTSASGNGNTSDGFDHTELLDSMQIILEKMRQNPKTSSAPATSVGRDVNFEHSFQTPVVLQDVEQVIILQALKYELLSDIQIRDILFAITISPFTREEYDSIHWDIGRAKKVLREKIAKM